MEVLCAVQRITSRGDLERIRSCLSDYVACLPGIMTPQRYTGIDDSVTKVDVAMYVRIVENTLDKFDRDWPLRQDGSVDPLVMKLTVVDGATTSMLSESLRLLTAALSESTDERKTRATLTILQGLLKSDAIFSALVDACRVRQGQCLSLQLQLHEAWRSATQVLVSLPGRVANKMQLDTPELYSLRIYVRLLCHHVCRAMQFVNEGYAYDIAPKVTVFSSVINKILITLKPIDFLVPFVDILKLWCYENTKNEARLVRSVLRELDSMAVEHMVVLFLKHCEPEHGVLPVFGDLLTAPHWRYVLTTKIPLLRHYADERLMFNLISYLASCENENHLSVLTTKLLDVWADSSILNHTPAEKHEYTSRLIILSVKTCGDRLQPGVKEKWLKLLFAGVSMHLECTDIYVRAMGMLTAEVCMNHLSESNAPKLKFDYQDMPAAVQPLVESLQNLRMPTMSKYPDDGDVESSVSEKIHGLAADILQNLRTMSDSDVEEGKANSEQNLAEKESAAGATLSGTRDDQGNDSDLDSDDDLIPYDMDEERDKPVSGKRPTYLRDLRDNLTDERTVTDPEVFSESMSVCEELIKTQLPNDDASFAVELLELFVTLRQQSYIENFEVVVFRCCVEIVIARPRECAEFLCKQFYENVSKYSLSQRMLFLDVLSESAKRLSETKIENDAAGSGKESTEPVKKGSRVPSSVSIFIDTTKARRTQELCYDADLEDPQGSPEARVADWREIIERRIESHTKRFAHKTKVAKASANRFANFASSFFYPLLYGFGEQRESSKLQGLKICGDQENVLLLRYLKTLSAIMRAAENCPLALKMGKEILELTWTLRRHEEATTRFAAVECVASVLVSLPKDSIVGEMLDTLLEIREWLLLTQNVVFGEHDAKCRELNATVMNYVDVIIGSALT